MQYVIMMINCNNYRTEDGEIVQVAEVSEEGQILLTPSPLLCSPTEVPSNRQRRHKSANNITFIKDPIGRQRRTSMIERVTEQSVE